MFWVAITEITQQLTSFQYYKDLSEVSFNIERN